MDEWAGMFLALWPARQRVVEAINGDPWGYALAIMFGAFLLFRLFDIWKPWPARRLESLPGGWGATMDDVMAGMMAGLLITAITH
ncbi:MAG: phosphatidylglycerophosphatase A [Holophagales bacterium]|nr:phosphatidylglycerophosphatase A [Holophagales bacterium]